MRGAEVQALHQILQFLDELERSGEFRAFSLETVKPIAEAIGRFSPTAPVSPVFKALVSDAATVASFFRIPLAVPDQILKADAENLSFLKKIATGEPLSGVDLTVRIIKKAADQEMFFATLNNPFDFVFENMLNPKTITIFGREVDPGAVAFEAQGAVFDSPEALRDAYIHASEHEDLLWKVHCAGPCRFVSRTAGLGSKTTSA
jgi:hypothetical protein